MTDEPCPAVLRCAVQTYCPPACQDAGNREGNVMVPEHGTLDRWLLKCCCGRCGAAAHEAAKDGYPIGDVIWGDAER